MKTGNSTHYVMYFEATALSYATPTLFRVTMMIDIWYLLLVWYYGACWSQGRYGRLRVCGTVEGDLVG